MLAELNQLKVVIPKLSDRDKDFARDLIKKGDKFGVTPKQMFWVKKLIDRANGVNQEPELVGDVGNFAGVYALFAKAKAKLRFPKIRLQLNDERPVVLSVAGPTSKQPGVINVTDGGPFQNNRWYGRVAPDGSWKPGFKDFPELTEVAVLLKRLAEDPKKVASEYGSLTGYCCFCGKKLSDEKSTAAGYGPVCAVNFGLAAEYKAAKPVLEAA